MSKKWILISGGGTGGHIFPAVSIGQCVRKEYPEWGVHFVGALGKMEMERVPQAGFDITGLPIRGFQRKQIWKNWKIPFLILISLLKAFRLLRKYKPTAVVGVGGYASGPLLRMAQLLGYKTYIQEQNAFPGLTNRVLGKKVEKVFAGFAGLERFFPAEKIVLTGNPVRENLLNIEKKNPEHYSHFGLTGKKKVLLVLGGSLGARTINQAIELHLPAILDLGFEVIWQTGKSAFQKFEHNQQPGVWVGAFIEDMAKAYGIADVAISRAGALSVSEIVCVGVPTLFVPSPNVTDDHQTKNAEGLVEVGAAAMVQDRELNEKIREELKELLDPQVAQGMLEAQKSVARPQAVKTIVQTLMDQK